MLSGFRVGPGRLKPMRHCARRRAPALTSSQHHSPLMGGRKGRVLPPLRSRSLLHRGASGPPGGLNNAQPSHKRCGQGARAQDWPSPIQASGTPPTALVRWPSGSHCAGTTRRCVPWKGLAIPCGTRLDSHQHSGSERYSIHRVAHRVIRAGRGAAASRQPSAFSRWKEA